jgi:hypothetical protein
LLHARLDGRRHPAKSCPLLSGCRCAVKRA